MRCRKLGNLGARLYRGEVGYDFVGKRKIWYGISILITITAIVGLAVRGLNMGIEFKGGAVFTTAEDQRLGRPGARRTRRRPPATTRSSRSSATAVCASRSPVWTPAKAERDQGDARRGPRRSTERRSTPTWSAPAGVSRSPTRPGRASAIFMVLVVIYLAIAFEWRMAVAALVALIHDITITVGIYALVGFEVTPGTVIGLLTILGYSLYDTVVVFDSLKESTKDITKQTRCTYSEIANRSINSTLVRSINTTVVALLPVAGLLFIGGGVLGAGMLNDISLSLFVGLAAGAYSSIFIATPLVADLKEREPQMKALKKRVLAKRAASRRQGRVRRGRRPGVRRRRRVAEDAATAVVGPRSRPASRSRRPRPTLGEAPMTERHRSPGSCCSAASAMSPDYPKPGVMFKDITPLLADPVAFTALTDALAELCVRHGATKIVGLEARGFILAAPVAVRAGPRLHPGPQGRASSPERRSRRRTSWSTAPPRSRCTPRTWPPGDRVMVIDDVLATGGTAEASLELIRRAGAEVAGVAVLWSSASSAAGPGWSRRSRGAPLEALITV